MSKPTFKPKRLLLVHAHPDDESLFTGHVIAKAIKDGAEVFVLTLTRGERGRMKLEELKGLEGNLAAVGAFREAELKNALSALGVSRHKFAGTRAYLDSGFRINAWSRATKPKNLDEMALSAVSTAVISEDIYQVIKDFKPDYVLTYNRRGGFGHPDHKRANEASAMALRRFNKETRGKAPQFWVISEGRERFDVAIGTPETSAIKKAALSSHASQIAVHAETYSIVSGKEIRYDRQERIRRSSIKPWLFLKPIALGLWALPLGILMAFAGTMLHNITAAGPDRAPIGLQVALALTASLALSLRLLRESRGALYLMSLTFASSLYWLAMGNADGDVMIANNSNGQYWVYGSLIICAVVMIFPRVGPGAWRKRTSSHR
jgi:N-acetyl-1-D-myo-inositol-2-amino-2-deoxy-alpha-D-glucopyranoside deacetylase